MYVIELSVNAQKFLDKLDHTIKERIESALKRLEVISIPSNAKFIGRENDEKIFRYRIGDFRALYIVSEQEKLILITKIDKRSRIYD